MCPFEKGHFSILNKLENRGHFYDLTQVRNIIGLGHTGKFVEQKKIFSTIYIISVFRVNPNNCKESRKNRHNAKIAHSSLADYLAQVINAKNCPTTFYCIFQLVWVPMITTKNIRVCFLSSNNTFFS